MGVLASASLLLAAPAWPGGCGGVGPGTGGAAGVGGSPPACGDGQRQDPEQCDGSDPGGYLGSFTKVGDVAASRIARWNGTAWSALADGVPGQVLALERDGTNIYVSTYDEQQGDGAYLLGMFDGTRWRELATTAAGLTPNPDFSFNAIHAITGGLLLAGTAELDDGSGRGVLVYRDGRFQALGGGVNAISADRIAVNGEAVWIAGLITAAGPDASAVSSVGVARWKLP